jgi:hypothetical protein
MSRQHSAQMTKGDRDGRERAPDRRRPIFVMRLRAEPGAAGIRSLRWALKVLLRTHKLRCLDVREDRP